MRIIFFNQCPHFFFNQLKIPAAPAIAHCNTHGIRRRDSPEKSSVPDRQNNKNRIGIFLKLHYALELLLKEIKTALDIFQVLAAG